MKFKSKADSWWCKIVSRFVPAFNQYYWTTIGDTIYYPTSVTDPTDMEHQDTLNHEAVHIEQYKKLGVPLFLFLYLFVPLPMFLSYFRWRFEREAYLIEIRHGADPELIVDALWSGYFKPWPKFLMRRWFKKHA